MTKLTTERLEKFVNDIKTDGMCDITDSQVESALIRLLTYEQAADRPVGEIFRCSGNKTLRWWNDVPEGTVLYAAPVIPEQQQPIAYIFKHPAGRLFWSLTDESNQGQANVIPVYADPHELKIPPAIEPDYEVIKGIMPTANPDEYACCIAADMWNACRAEMLKAQPVSEPYKLKDAVEDIRNSGVEIDADKIKAERDALNSPVIPEGWKLVPIEPTAAMFHAFNDCDYGRKSMRERYIQMIEAAPTQESE